MTFTALLLTGGMSRRMGADKATLVWQGEPLWMRQARVLRELHPTALKISARVTPDWCPPDFEAVLDHPPSRGPLSGLAAALEGMRTSHLLALAIDLPQMTTNHLRELVELAGPGCGVVPEIDGRLEPLCAIYPMEAAAAAAQATAGEDVSLQSYCRALIDSGRTRIRPVRDDDRRLYSNFNTPEDLRLATKSHVRRRLPAVDTAD